VVVTRRKQEGSGRRKKRTKELCAAAGSEKGGREGRTAAERAYGLWPGGGEREGERGGKKEAKRERERDDEGGKGQPKQVVTGCVTRQKMRTPGQPNRACAHNVWPGP
jgi:hypothetical protein